jgi:alpha-L-fucosidase
MHTLFASALCAESIARGIPTPEQIAWHEMEVTMFIHYGPATWQNREYNNRETSLSEMTMRKLDTDQWCEAANAFGAKQIVFVAKHVGAFCWWQTDTSDYGIKNTPYKDGKGDVLAELAASCEKYGLKLGVYVYPGDPAYGAGIGSGGRTKDPARQEAYDKVFRQQLTEVLSQYGEMDEVWFDGSCVIEVGDILKKYAPKAMVFQGPHATIRWPGNEHGHSPYPAWQTVKKSDAVSGVSTGRHNDPNGDVWLPMEMDTTLLNKAWFWKPNWDHRIKTVDQLMDVYMKSVGRGGVLLLNATPDTTGLIPLSHMKRYKEFGEAIKRIYENKKGETSGKGKEFTITFDEPTIVSHIITMEDIRHGHIIRAYEVEALVGDAWHVLHKGLSVGYRQIDLIKPTEVKGLRLRITESVNVPQLKSFAAYEITDPRRMPLGANQEAWQKAGEHLLTTTWKTIDVDLTEQISDVGQYEVEIKPIEGITLKSVIAVMAETEAPRLITKLDRPYAWNINRTAAVTDGPEGRTALRVVAKSTGDGFRECRIYIRKVE